MVGIAPRLGTLARPRYLRMLAEIKLFHRHAQRVLSDPRSDRLTLGRFVVEGRYSDYFRDHFLLPLTGAIWSSSTTEMLDFPARYLFQFFSNHGMLSVKGSPTWKTVCGGSRVYVKRVTDVLGDQVRSSTPVHSLRRERDRVLVNGEAFDRAVVATHPDQALALLDDPTPDEREILGAFSYATNHTVLHTDPQLLPRAAGARASWNYLLDGCSTGGRSNVHVTYHLNRLQALREPVEYCVTLNQTDRIDRGQPVAVDGVPPPHLHDRHGRRPATAAVPPGSRQHVLLRCLPRLWVSRGRLPVGTAGGAGAGM